ncbi:MAG: hypothetical protein IT383_19520 [Deltaproteobacteria bacterium]|nr:hypothetical protein [Deltaproteobacteria bacterium]
MKQKKLHERLKAVRIARKTSDLVVHRDWVQVHLLAGFARSAKLSSTLVFKGGTALQKIGGLPDVEQVLTALKPKLCACLGWVDANT